MMEAEGGVIQFETEDQILSERVNLVHPEEIDEVVTEIGRADRYVEEVRRRIAETGKLENENLDFGNLQGLFGEMLVRVSLEHTADKNHDVLLDPVQDGSVTPNFTFKRKKDGQLYAYDKRTGKRHAEYDEIFLIRSENGDIPCVLETKVQSIENGQAKKGMKKAMDEKEISRMCGPIMELFQTQDIAYIVVATEEMCEEKIPLQNDFNHRGGIVAPLPFHLVDIWGQLLNAKAGK